MAGMEVNLTGITKEIYDTLMERYAESNREIANRYFGRDELYLEPFILCQSQNSTSTSWRIEKPRTCQYLWWNSLHKQNGLSIPLRKDMDTIWFLSKIGSNSAILSLLTAPGEIMTKNSSRNPTPSYKS